ncbi:hypothetical protein F53441_1633 [Fusarium austroafricanum]|uniref:DUF7908 domain-containing protein n=1 Tax=Fusarium austroafricanum TaxID=2364996 RepID=A0A8H4NYP9_9HYPO|nr:hypothetical protein F53441_1633 [Fusarium austroafricanum]
MKGHIAAFALLGSVFGTVDVRDIHQEDTTTWCITYLSTYLAPVSFARALPPPSENSSDSEPLSTVITQDSTLPSTAVDIASSEVGTFSSSAVGSIPTSASFDPAGQRIILLITSSGGTTKRQAGGFVGNGSPDICTYATIFVLVQGRLSENGVPLAYLGDDYQKLQPSPTLPIDSITTTFSSEGGVLRFANSALPNGQASFCQASSDGQVYMTFTSKPAGCVSVVLNVYPAEQCINSRLDGLGATTTGSQSIESSVSDTVRTSQTEAQTSGKRISNIFSEPNMSDTISDDQTEMSTAEGTISPTFSTSLSDATETLQETSEPILFPTFAGTGSFTGDVPTYPTHVSEVPNFQSSSIDIPASQPIDKTETSEPTGTPNASLTGVPQDTDLPSDTFSDSPTATKPEPGGVITNAVVNGRFSKSSNSGSRLVAWSGEGEVKQQKSDCYKADGSPDNGCVALGSSSADARKRAFGGLGSIFQMLSNLAPSRTTLYTVQFYYVVITAGERQSCSINAYLGNRQFYTMGLFSGGGVSVSWNRGLTTVQADSRSANFGISMTCSGNGLALLYVDSVFVSNQVTPDNIDHFQLDFGDSGDSSETPSKQQTSGAPLTPTRRPIDPKTSNTEQDVSTPTATTKPPTRPSERPPFPSQSSCPDGYKPPGFCSQIFPVPSKKLCKKRGQPVLNAYIYSVNQRPEQKGGGLQRCALACMLIDDCYGFRLGTHERFPCGFLISERLDTVKWRDEITPGHDVDWYNLDCFSCQLCGEMPDYTKSTIDPTKLPLELETTSDDWEPTTRHIPQNSTDWMPHPETSTGSTGHTPVSKPTSFQPPRDETSVDVEPTFVRDTTTDWPEHTSDEFSESSYTSLEPTEAASTTDQETTTTSETTTASEEPSPTCKYTHGEMCNFNQWDYPKDVLCSWEGIYNGGSWTVSRTEYPVQGRLENCIAICQGISNCKIAGYSMITNRCYFSSSELIKDDFTPESDGWKSVPWLDKRCYTYCDDCIPDSAPQPPIVKCAYADGDTCQRVSPPDGTICDYSAWMAGMYVTGDQMINQYPASDQTSPEKCAAICRAMEWCNGSGYKDGRCKWTGYTLALSGMPVPLETDRDPSWNSVWDDPNCFDCPGCH